jgi:hypothetical protein
MVGGVFVVELEFTATVKEQAVVLLTPSLAVQLTVVAPTAKVEPEGGVQLAVTPGQLSVAAGAG